MVEISLHDAEFFAYHGFYPEEQLLGSHFLVDVAVSFVPEGDLSADDISHTINYEQLYLIACEEMKHTRKLIDSVAQSMFYRIQQTFPLTKHIRIAIKKINPPLGAKVGYSGVVITYGE